MPLAACKALAASLTTAAKRSRRRRRERRRGRRGADRAAASTPGDETSAPDGSGNAHMEEMDQYLDYVGGPAGALALTGVAAASAFYLASRPSPQRPLVALDRQSFPLPRERNRKRTRGREERPKRRSYAAAAAELSSKRHREAGGGGRGGKPAAAPPPPPPDAAPARGACGCAFVEPIRSPINLAEQTDVVKGPELVRVSKFYKESKDGQFVSYLDKDVRTLYDSFRQGAKESNNGPCLGWREGPNKPYQWLRYDETLLRARNFGSGLVSLGLAAAPSTFVGLYSQNCPEWVLAEQGAYCYSMVVVPLYDTLGPDACAYIIAQAEIAVVVVEDDAKANLLLDKAPRSLRRLISIKETRPATNQRARNRGIEVLRFEDVESTGAARNYPEVPPRPEDLCTVCYTSGTTGNPKGVMLSHANVIASVCSVLLQLGDHKPRRDDVMISFLPLAHMLERCCENGMYMVGGSVGFFSGDVKRLPEDMKALRPTVMPAVPRLLNRMYDKVMSEVSGSVIKRVLFNMAYSAKEGELKRGIIRNNSFWDRLVFRKVQEGMGNRLRLMLVGSAPLAGNVLTFARCALGCLVVEGYGQTECCAPITLTVQGDHVPEHVGPPVACCCIKLVDVPEMEYYAVNGQGEICIKGTNVFLGYYKSEEETRETIDPDGWHHTGDVGMWLPSGTLKIIDRKKHIFKLSQGEYIVPEKIENIYIRSQYVQQVFVVGESLKSCIVAVVVPDVEVVKGWAHSNSIPGTLSVLCNHPEVKQLIMDDMIAWGKDGGLKSFEQVKDIYLHPDPFSVQNGLLTPTLKSKRPQLKAYFKPQIEDMYAKLT